MADASVSGEDAAPTPSAFMRGRRPALYSDSLQEPSAPLSREAFEYRLHSVTSRSEEAQFQRFAHALLEVEVCPNLVPQTGPTGGGDSKVDAETYAVADALAERWWSGVARDATREDWAFAISAAKDWHKKANKDIDNVLASGKTYHRIHFLTNQFIKDKDRAKAEKELTRRAGKIPVRIFDRTWIMQAIFDHDHWAIAERELSLPAARKVLGALGPMDADRVRQLLAVEAEISDPARFADSPLQLAHAWLTSALLARGLERPRDEVDQRFDRAIAAAVRSKSSRGQRRMIYQKIWTAFWWYDDYMAVIGGYDAIEALLDDNTNAWDLEQLTNLYSLLNSAELHQWLPTGAASLASRYARLKERLERLANRRSHPTDAAWARTHLLHLNFLADPKGTESQRRTVKELHALLRQVERLPEYPVEPLCDVISELTTLPFPVEGIDEVADRAGELVGSRLGSQAQVRQLLDRAASKIEQGSPEDALRLMGRAMGLLDRQPSREMYLEGAWVAARAYCDVGLFCAARAHLLLGLNRSLRSVLEDAAISSNSLNFALRLAWVELAAGRLPLMLQALEYADIMAAALDLSDQNRAAYFRERENLEALLARAVAGTTAQEAPYLPLAPAIFEAYRLPLAKSVALALLGHPQEMLESVAGLDLAAIQAVPWPHESAGPIEWADAAAGLLRTRILGCEIVATGLNTQESRSLAMAVFAALEGFAATSFADRMTPKTDRLVITIDDTSTSSGLMVNVDEDECGEPVIRLSFKRGTLEASAAKKGFRDKAVEAVANTIGHVCAPGSRTELETMFKRDAIHERAFGLLDAVVLDDTSSASPTLAALAPNDAMSTPLIDAGRFVTSVEDTDGKNMWGAEMRTDDPPPDLLEFHHRRTRVLGVINTTLWERAKWQGVGYLIWPDGIPELYLMFSNADAAAKILRGWRRRIGSGIADRILRLAILTDVDKEHRAYYRIGIAPANVDNGHDAAKTLLITLRLHTMTPETSINLDNFLKAFRQTGTFRLGVAVAPASPRIPFTPLDTPPIELHELQIKAAWEIEPNDALYGMMLRPEDDPFIPPDVADPSGLTVVRWLRSHKERDRRRR